MRQGDFAHPGEVAAANTLYLLGWFLTNVAQEDLSGFLGEIAQRIDSFQARSVLERNLFAEEIDQLPISFLLS